MKYVSGGRRSRRFRSLPFVIGFMAVVLVLSLAGLLSATHVTTAAAQSDQVGGKCGLPSYLIDLASQVQADPRFVSASAGLSYVLATGNNESTETVVIDAHVQQTGNNLTGGTSSSKLEGGTTIYYPPETNLLFYSYGSQPPATCANTLGSKGVVGMISVNVPITPTASYDLQGMSLDHTNGVMSNGTAVSK